MSVAQGSTFTGLTTICLSASCGSFSKFFVIFVFITSSSPVINLVVLYSLYWVIHMVKTFAISSTAHGAEASLCLSLFSLAFSSKRDLLKTDRTQLGNPQCTSLRKMTWPLCVFVENQICPALLSGESPELLA